VEDPVSNKDLLLGMPIGTAAGRLRKLVMFELVKRLGLNVCFRCSKPIGTAATLSIEHKDSWQLSDDPVASFFDVDNIAFSHLRCNSIAAVRSNKRYESDTLRRRAWQERNRPRLTKERDAWRASRRAAGLPYT
jgi:hypothetical protein